MVAEINIHGPVSILSGEFPFDEVRQATSWKVEGSEYAPSFRKKLWDGRKHLLNAKTGAFPTGLLPVVQRVLNEQQTPFSVVDHREDPFNGVYDDSYFELADVTLTGKFSYQLDAAKKMVAAKQGVIRIATNGGKGTVAAAVTKCLNLKTLFIVTSKELLYQIQKMFASRLGLNVEDIGIVGDGNWEVGEWVTIATLDTLESRMDTKECIKLLESTEVLFWDECHHLGSETWFTVSTMCPAYYRFGMSGTPMDRTDGANLRLIAATGDIIVDIPNKVLVDLGVSARANIIFDKVTEPQLKSKMAYNSVYKQGVVSNDQLNNKVVEWTLAGVESGLSVLILISELEHGKILDGKLWTDTNGVFIPHQFIWGEESTEVRATALSEFAARRLPVLIASSILDEGVDVPTIDMIICAGSRKSKIRTLQRLGRGLRGDKLIVVEFSNFCHDFLLRHALQRYRDYKNEECFPIFQSPPDKDLIQKLWNQPKT